VTNQSLLSYQFDTLDLLDQYKFVLLLGGIGSGKSHTGSPWTIKKFRDSSDSLGLITANTYGQLQKATLASLFKNYVDWGIPFSYNQQKSLLTVGYKKQFLCLGLDNFDNHRGIEVGEWWGDEVAYNKEEAFEVMSGRLRDKRGKLDVLFTTTPKGFNWLYHYFHPDGDNHNPKLYHYVKAKTQFNHHLPDGYVDTLLTQYDEKLIQQELNGEFVNVTSGRIYYSFNSDINCAPIKKHPNYPLWVGMDFNPHKMSAVVGQVIDGVLHIIDEIFDTSPGSNTEKVCRELISRHGQKLTIVPDSTGKKATSNASRSDIQILKDYGFNVKTATNPFRVDRYAAVNGALSKQKVVIDSKLKNLIKDLESVSYKEGTDKPEVDDPMLTHMSDAFGYLVYRTVNPLLNKPSKITTYQR